MYKTKDLTMHYLIAEKNKVNDTSAKPRHSWTKTTKQRCAATREDIYQIPFISCVIRLTAILLSLSHTALKFNVHSAVIFSIPRIMMFAVFKRALPFETLSALFILLLNWDMYVGAWLLLLSTALYAEEAMPSSRSRTSHLLYMHQPTISSKRKMAPWNASSNTTPKDPIFTESLYQR